MDTLHFLLPLPLTFDQPATHQTMEIPLDTSKPWQLRTGCTFQQLDPEQGDRMLHRLIWLERDKFAAYIREHMWAIMDEGGCEQDEQVLRYNLPCTTDWKSKGLVDSEDVHSLPSDVVHSLVHSESEWFYQQITLTLKQMLIDSDREVSSREMFDEVVEEVVPIGLAWLAREKLAMGYSAWLYHQYGLKEEESDKILSPITPAIVRAQWFMYQAYQRLLDNPSVTLSNITRPSAR